MTQAFQVGSVPEYEFQETPQEAWTSLLGLDSKYFQRPYLSPPRAYVSIVNGGVQLEHANGLVFEVDKARELGYLLIKAAERHEDLVKQISLIEEQRSALVDKQESLVQELMK